MYDIQPLRTNSSDDDEDKTIVHACLYIYSPFRSASDISRLLGVDYTTCHQIGDKLLDIVLDKTYWSRSSRRFLKSPSIEAHLSWILDSLSGKLPTIRLLQAEGAAMHITVGIQYAGCGHSIELSKEVMGMLSSYRIDLEYYFFRIDD